MLTAHLKWPNTQDRWICARCGRSRFGDEAREEEARKRVRKITKEDIWGKK